MSNDIITKGMHIGIVVMLAGLAIGIIGITVGAFTSLFEVYQRDFMFNCIGIMWFLYAAGAIITIGSPVIELLRSKL